MLVIVNYAKEGPQALEVSNELIVDRESWDFTKKRKGVHWLRPNFDGTQDPVEPIRKKLHFSILLLEPCSTEGPPEHVEGRELEGSVHGNDIPVIEPKIFKMVEEVDELIREMLFHLPPFVETAVLELGQNKLPILPPNFSSREHDTQYIPKS